MSNVDVMEMSKVEMMEYVVEVMGSDLKKAYKGSTGKIKLSVRADEIDADEMEGYSNHEMFLRSLDGRYVGEKTKFKKKWFLRVPGTYKDTTYKFYALYLDADGNVYVGVDSNYSHILGTSFNKI